MIIIDNKIFDPHTLTNDYSPGSIQMDILDVLSSSNEKYIYPSLKNLIFELDLRIGIINASIQLNRSYFSFKVFRKSICNTMYWERTDEGGFLLKNSSSPSEAIQDIYINSRLYGTECATAMVIVYYKGVLDIYPNQLFDQMFKGIYLMNWQHLNQNLKIQYLRNLADYLPGDCRYFKNPDVDPITPEWQGENTIDLGDGTYYGHGIGIQDSQGIIMDLNKHRIPGSQVSAYLLESATRPNFQYLAEKYEDG